MNKRQEIHGSETGDVWIGDRRCMDRRLEMHGSETGDV